jgi:hypothetical protein
MSIYILLAFHSNYNSAKNIQDNWRCNQNNQSEPENKSNFKLNLHRNF